MYRLVSSTAMLVAALAAVAAPGSAQAAPAPVKTRLTLTVSDGEAPRPVLRKASLTCAPVGGSHKQAALACTELKKVNGNFTRLKVTDGMCTMQYQPVTVTAAGRWKGRKVSYTHTYGNACTLSTMTGAVFTL